MNDQAKDKSILVLGSLGWILGAVFIVLFFVMLRPADYRKGYDLGAQEQRIANIEKSMPYFRKPLRENQWVAGEITSIGEDSISINTITLQLNPLSDADSLNQRLLITDETRIRLFETFTTPREAGTPLTLEREIPLQEVQANFQLSYQPFAGEDIYSNEVLVSEINLYVYVDDNGNYIDVLQTQVR